MISAVFDYEGYSLAGGLLAMYAWRSWVFLLSFHPLSCRCFDVLPIPLTGNHDVSLFCEGQRVPADQQDLLVWTDFYAYTIIVDDWLGQEGYFRKGLEQVL